MPKRIPTQATVGDWRRLFDDCDVKEPGDVIYLPITIKGNDTFVTPDDLRRIGLTTKELTRTLRWTDSES